MANVKLKWFGRTFEMANPHGAPLVTLRRLTDKEVINGCQPGDVGIFHGETLIATIDFDDIFDVDGNRFYND